MTAALFAAALAGPGVAEPGWTDLVGEARASLGRGDGIAAEVSLQRALGAGAPRAAVAAYMGEAYLVQGEPEKARDWLAPEEFTRETAAWGFRKLAQLERETGDLLAAGRAFDEAMAITPRDASMWVEIGRLRYIGGEHMLANDAADYALKLEPGNVRALEFKAQFVRDQQGLAAALPWFERALRQAPRDVDVLGEYAATLGDLGRAKKMLETTRLMLSIEPGHPLAYYLQAVLAARAGKPELARGLFARAGDKLDKVPAAQLLEGVLEMQAGNYVLAAEALSRLNRLQPGNARARLLLAQAYARRGENRLLIHDFATEAARPEASPYLMALVARAYEAEGRRDLAAPLLDRAAFARRPDFVPVVIGSEFGGLLAAGRIDEARAASAVKLAANPGSGFNQAIAGDLMLAGGDASGALAHYRLAAHVRFSESLMLRMALAATQAGQAAQAKALVSGFLAANPADRMAMRMMAGAAVETQDWRRARELLEALRVNGGGGDVRLLVDLSRVQLRGGDAKAAEATARAAYALQRGSPLATEAWGLSLQALGQPARAQALLDKSASMLAGT
ncbi:MAG: tetratricopeptide repeat protein [Novosphingobium sp.]|nr:MAG: tetratricopeptide repeat protein [Novosphingobium sp.]